jgi:hypothetical protein
MENAKFKITTKAKVICHFCETELDAMYYNTWVKEHKNKPIWGFVRLCAKCAMFQKLRGEEEIISSPFRIPK